MIVAPHRMGLACGEAITFAPYTKLIFSVPAEAIRLTQAGGTADGSKNDIAVIDLPLDDLRRLIANLTEQLEEGDRYRATLTAKAE